MLFHSYYKRIMILCLILLVALLVVQAGISFIMLRSQTIRHSSTLSEKILSELTGQMETYFGTLDSLLDSVYQYPSFLAELNSDSQDKFEYPARSLLSQTAYFRPLRTIWLYNASHSVRSCYTRSAAEMYRHDTLDIYADPDDPSALCVRDFIEGDTDRYRVFCCEDSSGDAFLRVVKRVYQDKGRQEVGYIVCDLNALAPEGYAASALTSSNQYAWLYTANDSICDLSATQNENVLQFMRRYDLFHEASSGMVDGNYFCCSSEGDSGVVVCLFTDEIEIRESLYVLLKLLAQELAALLLIYSIFMVLLSRRVNRRITSLTGVLQRIEHGETQLRLPSRGYDEIDEICTQFNSMMDHMEITTAEEAQLRHAFEEARYQSLQAQINPHFLFNTMENIGAIALSQGCAMVDDMCGALSAMLRYSIDKDQHDRDVSLREELEYVRQYMLIINVRMDNELTLDLEVTDALLDIRLPRLSIQPLVDNAIRHGLRKARGEKRLRISALRVGDDVKVVVENNGIAGDIDEMNRIIRREATKSVEHTSIGICNIHERVQLLFGQPYGLHAEYGEGMTQLVLLLPGEERSEEP